MKLPHIPYRLGITGTVGSGKSWVGQILQGQGAVVLDTDAVVHQLYAEDPNLKKALVDAFGPGVLDASGAVCRPALRQSVLNTPEGKRQLEALVHPKVGERVMTFLNDPTHGAALRVVLVPLLFEANLAHRFDETWCVVVRPLSTLVSRLMKRDTITEAEAQHRLSLQWPQDQKAQAADQIIENSGPPEETQARVLEALNHLGARQHT